MRPKEWQRARVVTGYAGHARLLTEIPDDIVGWIADKDRPAPSPYSYSPSRRVISWHGDPAVIVETAHRRYEVWRVPAGITIYATDDEATSANVSTPR